MERIGVFHKKILGSGTGVKNSSFGNFIIIKKVLSQESVLKIVVGTCDGKDKISEKNFDRKVDVKNFSWKVGGKIGVVGEKILLENWLEKF